MCFDNMFAFKSVIVFVIFLVSVILMLCFTGMLTDSKFMNFINFVLDAFCRWQSQNLYFLWNLRWTTSKIADLLCSYTKFIKFINFDLASYFTNYEHVLLCIVVSASQTELVTNIHAIVKEAYSNALQRKQVSNMEFLIHLRVILIPTSYK